MVSGAARSIVRNVSDGLSRALEFDAVLRGDAERNPAQEIDPEAIHANAVRSVRDLLAAIGVEANQELKLDVTYDGKLRLVKDHPRAAEIEFALNADQAVRDPINRLASALGPTQLTIGPA